MDKWKILKIIRKEMKDTDNLIDMVKHQIKVMIDYNEIPSSLFREVEALIDRHFSYYILRRNIIHEMMKERKNNTI